MDCSSRLPSFGCFEPLLGPFWAKNGCFWPKTAQICEGTSRFGATAEFLSQNLDLARAPPRLYMPSQICAVLGQKQPIFAQNTPSKG